MNELIKKHILSEQSLTRKLRDRNLNFFLLLEAIYSYKILQQQLSIIVAT